MGQYKLSENIKRRWVHAQKRKLEAIIQFINALARYGFQTTDIEDVLYLVGSLRDGSVYRDKAARNYVVAYYQKIEHGWNNQSPAGLEN